MTPERLTERVKKCHARDEPRVLLSTYSNQFRPNGIDEVGESSQPRYGV